MNKQKIENKKTEIECLCASAYSQLTRADELVLELVNSGGLKKYEQNKIYNIILQLKEIMNL